MKGECGSVADPGQPNCVADEDDGAENDGGNVALCGGNRGIECVGPPID